MINNHAQSNGESYRCTMCGAGEFTNRIPRGVGGEVVECCQCSHLSLYPLPNKTEVLNFYCESGIVESLPVGDAIYDDPALSLLVRSDRRKNLRVLDVGCGLGEILSKCASMGHHVKGIEVTKSIVTSLKQHGYDVELLGLEQTDKIKEKFDWVICLDVIEHLRDPIIAIQRLASLVADHGFIVIQSPNGDAVSSYKAMSTALQVDPEHLHYFRPSELVRIFEPFGIQAIETYFYPAGFGFGSAKSGKSANETTQIQRSTVYRRTLSNRSLKEKIFRRLPMIRGILRSCVQFIRRIVQIDQIKSGKAFAFVLVLRKD